MLSDWLTVLYTHVQSRFHVFPMICKRGVGYLPCVLSKFLGGEGEVDGEGVAVKDA